MTEEVLRRALAAEAAAEHELEQVPEWLWDGIGAPVPVETIADSHYGLLVQEHENLAALAECAGEGHMSGLLFPARRQIWVDATEAERAPGRRRFTIGHELGHWVLHCESGEAGAGDVHCRGETMREEAAVEERDGGPRLVELLDYPPRELDANQFAAAMLMPEPLVLAEQERLGGDETRLAEAFGVSAAAMQKRLWFLRKVRLRRP